jgi:hypothetical protein
MVSHSYGKFAQYVFRLWYSYTIPFIIILTKALDAKASSPFTISLATSFTSETTTPPMIFSPYFKPFTNALSPLVMPCAIDLKMLSTTR